jgi:tetratricopeptide (TPR) repeat protein
MRFAIITILSFFLFLNNNNGQTVQQKVDSLVAELPTAKDDTNKISLLVAISRGYFQTDPAKGVDYGNKALQLAGELNYDFGILSAHNAIGRCYAVQNLLPQALKHFQAMLTMARKMNNQEQVGNALVSLGNVYNNNEEQDKAISYFLEAKAAYEAAGVKKISTVLNNLGSAYSRKKMHAKALDQFREAARQEEQSEVLTQLRATIYANAAGACTGLKKYDEALDYAFRALEIHQQMGNKGSMVNALNNIGKTYLELGKASYPNLPDSLQNKTANLEKALHYEKEAMAICEDLGMRELLPYIYTNMSNIYEAKGDYKTALAYFSKYDLVKDSIDKVSSDKEFARIEAEFKVQKTTDSLKYLNVLKDKEVEQKKLERNGSILLMSFAGIIGLLVVNRQKLRHMQKQEMAEAEHKRIEELAKQQLADFTKSIQEKNLLIEQFSTEIERYQALPCSNDIPDKEKSLGALQSSVILTEEQWVNFQALFEKVHSGYINRVKEKFPGLTAAELRFIILSKLELSNKEMSAMLGVSLEAVRISKHRMLKKINLPEGVSVYDLVHSI